MTNLNDNLISTLKLAGLNETEAKIYLACLEMGKASAWEIYKKTGIKRPTCYAVLENLVADEIAFKKNDGKRSIFTVIAPAKLLMTIDYRKNQFKKNLPLFEGLQSESKDKPKIRIYEGVEGILEAYRLGLDQPEGSEVLSFGSLEIWQEYNDTNKAYTAERVMKNINLRVLFSNTQDNHRFLKMDHEELRQTRFLPKEHYVPQNETLIFADTLVHITHSDERPFATVIENRLIANDERQRFEILWKISS